MRHQVLVDSGVISEIEAVVDSACRKARHQDRGRCRWCGAVVDPQVLGRKGKPQPHRMYCRFYVGPLEHRIGGASVGGDYPCVCGGWFRQDGLADYNGVLACSNSNQTERMPVGGHPNVLRGDR